MAEIAGGFLGPAIEVVKWVSAPIPRQFNYLCCFSANITSLKNEAQKLQVTEGDLQGKVDTARNDVRVISDEVETWLQNSKDIKDEMDGIINEVPNVEGGCLKLRARFSLSKRAKKTTDRLKELRDQCKFNDDAISRPRPPAATEVVPSKWTYNFDSRKKIEEDIMSTLRGGHANMMGICGMGGLGKTTMAKRIMKRAREEHVFEEVVMAVVSQPIDKLKIQLEIGGSLGLKLEGETSEAARVQKLHERLSGTKRTLVILDDVWETLELEDLGIPCGYKGCTTLLTSRNHDVLSAMNVQIVGMELLSEEESWFLFKDKVGTHADDTKLHSIAKEVMNECGGLPIALITVGCALKDKVNVYAWKSALRQLKRHDPDIPDFIKKVYNPLELSYNVLDPKYQLVFLLCCLYPEDADIPLERLTYFCMGLRLLEGGMVEERDRMHSLTNVLKDRSLLLDSYKGGDYVRMHDVVRDVCIFIARKNKYISGGDSSLQRYEFDPGYALLQIRNSTDKEIKFDGIRDLYVLSIEYCSLTSLPFTQRQNNLITLVLDSCEGLETLSVVGELVNLENLLLFKLPKLEEICDDRISSNSFQKLKKLTLDDLPVLKQLWMSSQKDLGKDFLPQLEGLDIRNCGMMETVFLWKGEDGNENTSCHHITKIFPKLKELRLEDLPNLISLCQGIEGIEFPLLKRITIVKCKKMKGMTANGVTNNENNSGGTHHIFCQSRVSFGCLKKLNTDRNPFCSHTIHVSIFNGLEELAIYTCAGSRSLFTSSMAGNLVNLKALWIIGCDEMVEVIKDDEEKGMSGGQRALLFPKLCTLALSSLPKLVSFCESKGIESIQFPVLRGMRITECRKMKGMVANGVTSNENNSGGDSSNASDTIHLFCESQVSFGCLKKLNTEWNPFCCHTIRVSLLNGLEELEIYRCPGSVSLFTSSMAGNLVNLKALSIRDCFEMVEVIKDEEEKGMSGGRQTALLFPKLQKLMLLNLPKLVSFCESKGIESIQFPVLRSMEITECKKMKGMVANGVTSNENNSGGDSSNAADTIHLFCESQQVSFGCLKQLNTDRNPFCCHTIRVSLLNGLEELKISNCAGSRSLFTSSMAGNLLNLKELRICECEEMVEVMKDSEEKGMSGGRQRALLFPKLHTLYLRDLPNLLSFCEWKCDVEFPSLRKVGIRICPNMKNFTFGSVGAPNLECFETDFKDYLLQVLPFNIVKKLSVSKNEKPLNCYQIHGSVFDRLEELDIRGYEGSMSLFSSSITGNLVNLTRLHIRSCPKMVKVIEEKEKVVSGAQRTTILFPKLQNIQLYFLHELVRFCEWKCDVELPSLRRVEIFLCHYMKSFTLGPLNTPKLESVRIDSKEFGGVKDLNDILQQQYINRTKEKQAKEAEKKKGGEEEQERKGETEEEQN